MSELLVADSFRVRQNPSSGVAEVRGWQYHLDRFAGAAASALAELDERPSETVDDFVLGAAERVNAFGEGFPRLELWLDPDGTVRWGLSERPLPALTGEVELRSIPLADVEGLAHLDRKGPNLERYLELNHEVGAEALLLDAEGHVVEGATTSLVWWDATGLGHRAASADRVASVTERLVAEAAPHQLPASGSTGAAAKPQEPARSSARPTEIAACEVWAVNALHGIRVVSHIDGAATREPEPKRLDWFRAVLDHSWEPVLLDGRASGAW